MPYTLIEEQVLGSAQSSVTFSSIPGTYKDLVLEITSRHSFGTTGDVGYQGLRFNSDSGTNYSFTELTGTGSTSSSARSTNTTGGVLYATQSSETSYGYCVVHIQSYASASVNKTALVRYAGFASNVYASVNLWRNTSAITTVSINATGSFTLASGSTFRLWGVA